MNKIVAGGTIIFIVLVLLVYAVVPEKWEINQFDEFLKGKFSGISASFDGILSLSPKEENIDAPAEEFFLSFVVASDGTAYLGTGHSGKIYRFDKEGKAELYYKVPEMDIYSLVLDTKGQLYAGSSPRGKIYRIKGKDDGEEFFNPQEKYIWDMMFTEKGNLLAAVGENGGIYEITAQGQGQMVFKAEDNHVLCMTRDSNGQILAGSGGKGLLFRFSPEGKVSLVFESSYEEIRSLAVDSQGYIYAAAGGTIPKSEKSEKTSSLKEETSSTIVISTVSSVQENLSSETAVQPGALFKINQEGVARKVWSSQEEMVYTLYWDSQKQWILFGTGNKGRIYALDKEEKISLLSQKPSEQVFHFHPFQSKVYILSNNPASLSILFGEQRYDGEYFSRVFDTGTISSWGAIRWKADLPEGGIIQLLTRTGNSGEPNKEWSDWSPPYQKQNGEKILNPKGRYIQVRAIFKSQSGNISPHLRNISLFYLQTNLRPNIAEIKILSPNEVYVKPVKTEDEIWGEDEDVHEMSRKKDKENSFSLPKKMEKKGYRTFTWKAEDHNKDSLSFSLYLRKEGEEKWRVLKENWIETIFAFDTEMFPDGTYELKIIASDSPSNPPDLDLNGERISESWVIDNSHPVIKDFQVAKDKSQLTVRFTAEDTFSPILESKYLVRPGVWRTIFPVDQICDSQSETFNITIPLPQEYDNLVTVKVIDRFGNSSVIRKIF